MANTPARRCIICGDALPPGSRPDRRTCSPAHAKRLQRDEARKRKRNQRERDREASGALGSVGPDSPVALRNDEVAALVGRKREDAIREAFIDEVRPVVREAIDGDVIRAIQGLVGLVPSAVLALEADLAGDDPMARSKAAALVVKYTMGNPNVTPPREDNRPQLTIINAMPDASEPVLDDPPDIVLDGDAEDLRPCDTCREEKPVSQFPGDGPRCQQCMDERKAAVMAALGDEGGSSPHVDTPAPVIPSLVPGVRVPEAAERFAGPPDPRRHA